MKPLTVNVGYPSLEGITEDKKTAFLIAGAYSGSHSELTAILQYAYHYLYFIRLGEEHTAEIIMNIALAEMHHLEILGKLLIKLGVDPVYCTVTPFTREFYSAKNVQYSKSPKKMLIDDISGEMLAVSGYEKIIDEIEDEKVQAVISRIKLDEELHVKALRECFEHFNG